ncbi:MAG: histidine--tRNA ligase [Candidatus Aenigmatarchaeota archaeon]
MKFQTPRGTRDFLPEDMIRRQYVLDIVRNVFEKWGFDPLETPAFEDWKLLAAKSGGGEEIKKEIYYFKDKSDRELGLRFDLTVPMARVIANNPGLPKPFRRYQIGPVWRYDRPGAGRWREFVQCDVDIVGSSSSEADAIIIATACDCLCELGFSDFIVRINNRKIIEAFLNLLKIKNINDVFRSIDKLEKFGEKIVIDELNEKRIEKNKIKEILEFIKIDNLEKVFNLIKNERKGIEGINEIKEILSTLDKLDFREYIKFDSSLVRGLDYYTGSVFEIVTMDSKLSIGGGGRYDRLIELFGGKPTPATGISLGIDRIVELMKNRNMFNLPKTLTKIFVANVTEKEKDETIKLAKKLIGLGLSTEFDVFGRNLSKQLEYVNSKNIPFTIIIGEKELKNKKIKLRNMKSGEEKEIDINNLEQIKTIVYSRK